MAQELFLGYRGVRERDGNVAAAQVSQTNIRKLAQFTGGIAVSKKVRGGSMVYDGLVLNGETAKIGDYVVADRGDVFLAVKKTWFEEKFKLHGVLRDNVQTENLRGLYG